MWREGLVQGEGLEPFHRLGAAEGVETVDSGSAAPTYNNPSGPWTWLAFPGREIGRQARVDSANGGGPDGPGAAPSVVRVAYDWRQDLKADTPPGADPKQEVAGADHTTAKEEPEQQQAAKEVVPPKRKKPKFL